ncbi:hypothetical protein NDI56_15970 [Haloarcula sp. S1CR25-12]|uniref:SH3 domain-containing protein n=1 Tax=Haloarcula saliterrae TaxID=2950534 RepID=A0ABU2FF86_9EURY|nr:hypothetical protein [Haloarcula sp. S1CR25-12]MDS0260902.1 hypothetical protein [Haloarcula sp. S1CR25-12]
MNIRYLPMNALSQLKKRSRTALKTTAAGATLLTLAVGGAAAQPDQAAAAADLVSGNALQIAQDTADSSTAYLGERAGDWVRWVLSETGEWVRWAVSEGAEQN